MEHNVLRAFFTLAWDGHFFLLHCQAVILYIPSRESIRDMAGTGRLFYLQKVQCSVSVSQ